MKKTSIALAAAFALGAVTPTLAAEPDLILAPNCQDKVEASMEASPHLLALPIAFVEHLKCIIFHPEG